MLFKKRKLLSLQKSQVHIKLMLVERANVHVWTNYWLFGIYIEWNVMNDRLLFSAPTRSAIYLEELFLHILLRQLCWERPITGPCPLVSGLYTYWNGHLEFFLFIFYLELKENSSIFSLTWGCDCIDTYGKIPNP